MAGNLIFPKTDADYKLIKAAGMDCPIKEIRFFHDTESKPWKCSKLELLLGSQKTVTLTAKKPKLQDSKKVQPNRVAKLDRKIRRIKLDERNDISAIGCPLSIRYYDGSNKQIAHHDYYTTTCCEMAASTVNVDDGFSIIGVSLTTDSDACITWVNFLLWPDIRQIN